MLHWLAPYLFSDDVSRLLGYISVRAAGAAVTTFLFAVLLGPLVIRWLSRLGVGERIDGTGSQKLEELHAHKKGTPTMGGLFVVAGILLPAVIVGLAVSVVVKDRVSKDHVRLGILVVSGLAALGLLIRAISV